MIADPERSDSEGPLFESLSPSVVSLWRIGSLFGWGVVLAVTLVGSLLLGNALFDQPLFGLAFWMVLPVLVGLWLFWYPRRAYEAWGYRVDERILETKSGIVFRVLRLLPLSRLQHVDLRRGPLERMHGLASVVLYTAGTHEAVLVIPGLEHEIATRLRDQLVAVGGDDAV